MHGRGVKTDVTFGIVFYLKGTFYKNKPFGIVKVTLPTDDSVYIGEIKDGKFFGKFSSYFKQHFTCNEVFDRDDCWNPKVHSIDVDAL